MESVPEVIALAVGVGGRVDAEEDESREFEDQTPPFCIQSSWIHTQLSNLLRAEVASHALLCRQITIARTSSRPTRAWQHTQDSLLGLHSRTNSISRIYSDTAIPLLMLRQAEVSIPAFDKDHVVAQVFALDLELLHDDYVGAEDVEHGGEGAVGGVPGRVGEGVADAVDVPCREAHRECASGALDGEGLRVVGRLSVGNCGVCMLAYPHCLSHYSRLESLDAMR